MKKEKNHNELSWRRVVVRKLLNLAPVKSDYSTDSDSASGSESEQEFCFLPGESRLNNGGGDEGQLGTYDAATLPKLRRRNSATFRDHYINTKEIRICAATWNVGGRVPPDEIDIGDWLQIEKPADLYVIGIQEIIPLNAVNIFGVEDSRPAEKWEKIIRQTLNQVPHATKFKSYSNPPSPSKFKPSEDMPDVEDEVSLESWSDLEEDIYPLMEEPHDSYEVMNSITDDRTAGFTDASISINNRESGKPLENQFSSFKRLDRLNCLKLSDSEENFEAPNTPKIRKLTKTLSGTERIGLSWPEKPLHLLSRPTLEKSNSFRTSASFKSSKSFRKYNSKLKLSDQDRIRDEMLPIAELDLESLVNRKRTTSYVRIVSKKMVGIFITIWVQRSLRKHIQNVEVSTVGVGAMGYIGNKGSISVSMSIHQTPFCFICTHLASGEKDSDAVKRNADVHEIHRRTRFSSLPSVELPRRIYDHERIIWLGDLNYRINLSYDRTKELISNCDWAQLVKQDQLIKELNDGGAFGGWSEGTLSFAPTYKYELDSESYIQDNSKAGKRTPAWCDRILSFGTGMRLINYCRSEVKLSDHRPVSASYMVDVEVFYPKKLQRILTFTDAEVEELDIVVDVGLRSVPSRLGPDHVSADGIKVSAMRHHYVNL